MKKIILFLVLCLGFASLKAQVILPVKKFIYEFNGTAADTVGSVDTTWNKSIQLNKLDGLFYNAKVKLSDVAAGAACTVALQGKMFANDSYSTITTVDWKGGGTDTTILFTQNTNKVYWRYLNFQVTRTASKAKITKIDLSLKK